MNLMMLQTLENMDVNHDNDYCDEHYTTESDDDSSEDEEYEDYYDYRHNKYYL